MRRLAAAIALDLGQRAEDLIIEARDAFRRALRDGELDIRNAEIDLAEALLVGAVEAELVAPRAGRLDVIIVFLVAEFGALELLLHRLQPLDQGAAVGGNDADMAAHHQRLS